MVSPTLPDQSREPYSGLEVANDHAHNAPEVDLRHQPDKEAVFIKDQQYGSDAQPQRKILGMRRRVAYIVFVIVGLVVIGAVVGGAVGATQSSSSNSSPSATTSADNSRSTLFLDSSSTTPSSTTTSTQTSTSTTSTASETPTPIGEGEGTYTCPESDDKNYITSSGTGSVAFRQLCDTDWPDGAIAASGSTTDTVEDLSTVLEYSLTQCIEQCAVYSLNNNPPCVAVTYGANVTLAQSRGIGGNCFLKSAHGARAVIDNSGQAQSAYIIGR